MALNVGFMRKDSHSEHLTSAGFAQLSELHSVFVRGSYSLQLLIFCLLLVVVHFLPPIHKI